MKELLQQALMGDYPQLVAAVREYLAQPAPEPVAYRSSRNNGKTWIITEGDPTDLMPDVGGIVVPLYAAPPAAPAIGKQLSDDDLLRIATSLGLPFGMLDHDYCKSMEIEPGTRSHGEVTCDGMVRFARAAIAAAPAPVVPNLAHKPTVQHLMDLARKFRSAPGDLYDGPYKALQDACYAALSAAPVVPLTDEQINDIWNAKDLPEHRSHLSPWGMDRIRAIIAAANGIGGGGK